MVSGSDVPQVNAGPTRSPDIARQNKTLPA